LEACERESGAYAAAAGLPTRGERDAALTLLVGVSSALDACLDVVTLGGVAARMGVSESFAREALLAHDPTYAPSADLPGGEALSYVDARNVRRAVVAAIAAGGVL
jgi:hypothetical protein